MIFRALEFAAKAHAGQYRKGSRVPYLIHPLRVCELLVEAGCSETAAVAGILHDTVEDTAVTLEDLRREFGPRIAELVEGASEPDKKDTWENRKAHTLQYLSGATDEELICLSLADKLDNLRSFRDDLEREGEQAWRRFKRGREQQRWYYESLARVFEERVTTAAGRRLLAPFLDELAAVFPRGARAAIA